MSVKNITMPINLKKATLADIPVLLELEKSVAGKNTYSPMLEADEWTEEFRKGIVCLIEKDAVVVGDLSYERKTKDHAYISGLAIDPRFQGHGIAREALVQLLEELKNINRIDLVTHPDNASALKLYRSLGFVVESRKENYYGDGEPRLVLVLQR
jgi:ribosomal protein S18 acetylase RimI-like enzyme